MENLVQKALFYTLVSIVILLSVSSLGLFIYFLYVRYMFNYHLDNYFNLRKLAIRRVTDPQYAKVNKNTQKSKKIYYRIEEKNGKEENDESQKEGSVDEGEGHGGSRECHSSMTETNQMLHEGSKGKTRFDYDYVKREENPEEVESIELYADVSEQISSPIFV